MRASDNEFPQVTFAEGAAPATPAAGLVLAYAKTDGKLYIKDDAGAETDLTAGGGGGSDWWTTVTKGSDQTVTNSATLTDDTALQFATVSGGIYVVEFFILYSGNDTTGDYRWGFLLPLAATAHAVGQGVGLTAALASADYSAIATASTFIWPATSGRVGGTDASHSIFHHLGRVMFTSNAIGTAKYQFANSAADTGRESTTRAGSVLRYRHLNP